MQYNTAGSPVGCPVQTGHQNKIHWFLRKQPIEEIKDLKFRVLVSGRVLELNPLSELSTGEFRCWTSNDSRIVSAWVNVSLEGEVLYTLGIT